MADYSISPERLLAASRELGYIGLHIEQGVPILDRDLNLMHDLIAQTVREIVTRYIGDGAPAGAGGFAVQPLPAPDHEQDFLISAGASTLPGRYLVAGIEVMIAEPVRYSRQPGLPKLTTPADGQPDPRIDTVYLDVFLDEVDAGGDPALRNSLDVGVQTSVRLRPGWVVRVAEGGGLPPAPPGHNFHTLARLARPPGNPAITAAMITDRRQGGLTVSDLERRLRRVEMALLPAFVTPQFTPKLGAPGDEVQIFGTNFNVGAVQVFFGDVAATRTTVGSATQITTRVPRGAATEGEAVQVLLSVENAAGRTATNAAFTVMPAPAFAAPGAQFEPDTGDQGTEVTLHGANFNVAGLAVSFGTVAATSLSGQTSRQVKARVPPGLVPAGSASRTVTIKVTTEAGTVESDDPFVATQAVPAPAFATVGPQFTPKQGAQGDEITLNGKNFNIAPLTVKFGTTLAPNITSTTATQIKVRVPAVPSPPQTLRITVETPGGPAESSSTFTVTG
ncbi:IPT/TIG domain-containing protein [Micromonospora rhizosphaerae]|uniref:IPT/TIG domain-containing protein n=1 Tax=Micromonospora rhizosphaerae TaxID=568872 RepID=A0A1C6SZH5_9ACTN|nr:IPT/TIG domain-containing protein [Micromonospora rhizosphaerae]SCL34984.1 IPT/TIG domain-containing protein [Micromonospora rhizosphaerae]